MNLEQQDVEVHPVRPDSYRDSLLHVLCSILVLNLLTMVLSLVEVTSANVNEWLSMATRLWPDYDPAELTQILNDGLQSKKYNRLLCRNDFGVFVGLIDLFLRHDYVEGSSTNPVGYIEGIFVKPEFRNQGVAKFMVEQGEIWAKQNGCLEFASDTSVTNIDSQNFHESVGFEKSDVVVHFIKKLS